MLGGLFDTKGRNRKYFALGGGASFTLYASTGFSVDWRFSGLVDFVLGTEQSIDDDRHNIRVNT